MTQPISEHYEYAQQFVAAGLWQVDPEDGVVYGVKRQPFCRITSWGYIQIKFRHPVDYRVECGVLAHRVIWEFVNGPIADRLQINHLNGIKSDNRLSNLEAVTASANMSHAFATGLNKPNRSGAGLSPDQVLEIYRRCYAGERDSALAAEFGVKRLAVNNIRNGWNWQHLKGHRHSA